MSDSAKLVLFKVMALGTAVLMVVTLSAIAVVKADNKKPSQVATGQGAGSSSALGAGGNEASAGDQTGGQGVDSALECAGNANALRSCLAATRTRGTIALCGLHVEDAAINPMELASRELDLVGVWAYSVHDWARVAAQVESGAFPVEEVVTSTIPLARILKAGFDDLLDPAGDEIKILVEPA